MVVDDQTMGTNWGKEKEETEETEETEEKKEDFFAYRVKNII